MFKIFAFFFICFPFMTSFFQLLKEHIVIHRGIHLKKSLKVKNKGNKKWRSEVLEAWMPSINVHDVNSYPNCSRHTGSWIMQISVGNNSYMGYFHYYELVRLSWFLYFVLTSLTKHSWSESNSLKPNIMVQTAMHPSPLLYYH